MTPPNPAVHGVVRWRIRDLIIRIVPLRVWVSRT
jgi:hypothetical protein